MKPTEKCPRCGADSLKVSDLNPASRPGVKAAHCIPCGFYQHPYPSPSAGGESQGKTPAEHFDAYSGLGSSDEEAIKKMVESELSQMGETAWLTFNNCNRKTREELFPEAMAHGKGLIDGARWGIRHKESQMVGEIRERNETLGQTLLDYEKLTEERDAYREALEEIQAGRGDPLPGSNERASFGSLIRRAERVLARFSKGVRG